LFLPSSIFPITFIPNTFPFTCPTNNREECICWLEKWLPEDLNNNVRILSLSYDSNIMASVHNDVTFYYLQFYVQLGPESPLDES
jgi:hypothetical protein